MILEHISHDMDERATELKVKLEEISFAFEEKAAVLMAKLRELKQASADQKSIYRKRSSHSAHRSKQLGMSG